MLVFSTGNDLPKNFLQISPKNHHLLRPATSLKSSSSPIKNQKTSLELVKITIAEFPLTLISAAVDFQYKLAVVTSLFLFLSAGLGTVRFCTPMTGTADPVNRRKDAPHWRL
ncbi:hypothetical protein U1Q18_023253 [Sarracenia purpurea var. burkii]